MSKLAHSNKETMIQIEIKNSYDELSEYEFFEHMDANNVEPDLIEKTLGSGVLNSYMHWIYLYIK